MFLALREFNHAKVRYALVTLVIVMVSALVFILSGLAAGLSAGNTEAIRAAEADGFVVAAGSEYSLDRSRLSQDDIPVVQSAPGITAAAPMIAISNSVSVDGSGDLVSVSVLGVPAESFITPGVTSGNTLAEKPDGIVIDQSLVYKHVAVGDTVTFQPSGVQFEVVGITSGHQYRLAPTLFMTLDSAAQLNPELDGIVNSIAVRGDKASINALPELVDNTMIGSTADIANGLPGEKEQNLTLSMIKIFLVVIAAGIIAAFFFILTLQKMSELGVMKALGATTKVLAQALMIQSIILGTIGILIGISIADTVTFFAKGIVPYQVSWQQMVIYGGLLLAVAVVGTLLSLIRIARVDPLDAIS